MTNRDMLANDLNAICCELSETFCGNMSCTSCLSEGLAKAGYRKATDVAAEIFAEIERLLSANMSGEFRCDSVEWFDYYELHLAEDIAELKKKFTEDVE